MLSRRRESKKSEAQKRENSWLLGYPARDVCAVPLEIEWMIPTVTMLVRLP